MKVSSYAIVALFSGLLVAEGWEEPPPIDQEIESKNIKLNGQYSYLATGTVAPILGQKVEALGVLVGAPLAATGYMGFDKDGRCYFNGRRNLAGVGDASQIINFTTLERINSTGTESPHLPQKFPTSDLSIYETCECTYEIDERGIGLMQGRFCDAIKANKDKGTPAPTIYWSISVSKGGKVVKFVRNDWTMLQGTADFVESLSGKGSKK